MAVQENDTMHIANVLNDYGEILREVEKYDQALEKTQAALVVYKKITWKPVIARTLVNIADIYTRKGEYGLAQDYFIEALNYDKYIRSEDYAVLFNKLGSLYLKVNKLDKAEEAFQKSLARAEEHNFKELIQSNNHNLYKIYTQQGLFKEALAHLVTTANMKDYLLNEDKAKRNCRDAISIRC